MSSSKILDNIETDEGEIIMSRRTWSTPVSFSVLGPENPNDYSGMGAQSKTWVPGTILMAVSNGKNDPSQKQTVLTDIPTLRLAFIDDYLKNCRRMVSDIDGTNNAASKRRQRDESFYTPYFENDDDIRSRITLAGINGDMRIPYTERGRGLDRSRISGKETSMTTVHYNGYVKTTNVFPAHVALVAGHKVYILLKRVPISNCARTRDIEAELNDLNTKLDSIHNNPLRFDLTKETVWDVVFYSHKNNKPPKTYFPSLLDYNTGDPLPVHHHRHEKITEGSFTYYEDLQYGTPITGDAIEIELGRVMHGIYPNNPVVKSRSLVSDRRFQTVSDMAKNEGLELTLTNIHRIY